MKSLTNSIQFNSHEYIRQTVKSIITANNSKKKMCRCVQIKNIVTEHEKKCMSKFLLIFMDKLK